MNTVADSLRGQHFPADDLGLVEWAHDLDQLVADVVATLEYSPYPWVHAIDVGPADGLKFRGDRFVATQRMTVTLDNPDADGDGYDDVRIVTISLRTFVAALRQICRIHRIPVDRAAGGDIDADIADQILQMAAYGGVVFG